ncbi:MAG: hypothetical protein HGA39_08850 [Coriobacteriia bacterium]|nr:hypothetical protein [Coriobacteriia bacterium]
MSAEAVIGILVGIGGFATAIGSLVWAGRKAAVEKQAADDAASERLIRLVEREAEKKVSVVRLELEVQLKQQEVNHLKELEKMRAEHRRERDSMRESLERQISDLRGELEEYRCFNAPTCETRRRKISDPVKVGGTD